MSKFSIPTFVIIVDEIPVCTGMTELKIISILAPCPREGYGRLGAERSGAR